MADYNSYIDSYLRNKALRDKAEKDSEDWLAYNAGMQNSTLGGITAGINGAASLLGMSAQMAEAPDTGIYERQIDRLGMFRDGKTWDINQLMQNRSSLVPQKYTYEDVGGISDGAIAGGTAASALSGAATGFTIGGPIGAAIGGLVGIGTGLIGGYTGRKRAEDAIEALNSMADYQTRENEKYFNTQADKINDFNYSHLWTNRAAEGGGIHIKKQNEGKFTEAAKRHHMSVQEFARHVLAAGNKGKYSATMRKRANFARNAAGWAHAEGGQMDNISTMDRYNTHGGYFAPNNLIKINEGGTHEQNPNGGVQMGVDPQGIPNLVEEGENIYKDYVFSDRLKADKSELKKFNIPEKYEGRSFSYIADKLSEEAKDRPNDAVSANGMGAMLDRLQACQEEKKQKLEEARIMRQLKKMSPEELIDLGASLSQQPESIMPQEQMAMQQAQPMVEAPVAPQPEVVQPMMPEQQPVIAACGGRLKKYDGGGLLADIRPETEEEKVAVDMQRLQEHVESLEPQPTVHYAADGTPFYMYDNDSDMLGLIGGPTQAGIAFLGRMARGVAETGSKVATGVGKFNAGRRTARAVSKVTADATKQTAKTLVTEYEKLMSEVGTLRKEGKFEEAAAKLKEATAKSEQMYENEALHNKAWRQRIRLFPKAVEEAAASTPVTIGAAPAASTAATEATSATAAGGRKVWPWLVGIGAAGTGAGLLFGARATDNAAKGTQSKTPVDSKVGSYNHAAGSGGAYIEGYSEGCDLVRKYDWPDTLGAGPVSRRDAYGTMRPVADDYQFYNVGFAPGTMGNVWTRNYTSPIVPEAPLLVGDGTDSVVVSSDFIGPMPRTAGAGTKSSGRAATTTAAATTRKFAEDIPRVTTPLVTRSTERTTNIPVAFVQTRWGNADPAHNYVKATTTATTGDPIWAQFEAGLLPGIAGRAASASPAATATGQGTAVSEAKQSGPAMLPTWPRYAGAIGNGLLAAYNATQDADRLDMPNVQPVFMNGRLALDRQRYTPIDQQSVVNPVMANTQAGYRSLLNSGLGASTSAALLAAMNAGNQGIGNATVQGRLYNDQQRAGVVQQNNAAAQAEADFYRGINATNTQIANQNAWQNYYGDLRQQMYNDQQETAKWNAVSQALDAGLTDLSNIGRENFTMNQVNSNRALLGYWVDVNGIAHYTTPEGREVTAPAESVATVQAAPVRVPLSPARQKEIHREVTARLLELRKKHGLN